MGYEYKFKKGDVVRLVKKYSEGRNHTFEDGTLTLGNVYEIELVGVGKYPYELVGTPCCMAEDMLELVEVNINYPPSEELKKEWTDKHYNFYYTLTEKDVEQGKVKLDPYFVSQQWKLGSKDETGVLFHCLKNLARWGDKNSVEREIQALYAQARALARLHNVVLVDND